MMLGLCILSGCVSDKPGPPESFKVSGVTESTINLVWDLPKDNGGSEITSYTIEKRDANKRQWSAVGKTSDLKTVASTLIEGNAYMFRVAAENECGLGEFAELAKSATPKSQYGTYHHQMKRFTYTDLLCRCYLPCNHVVQIDQ